MNKCELPFYDELKDEYDALLANEEIPLEALDLYLSGGLCQQSERTIESHIFKNEETREAFKRLIEIRREEKQFDKDYAQGKVTLKEFHPRG